MAQSPKTSQGGASLSSKVRLPSMKSMQPIRYVSNLQFDNAGGSSHPAMLSAGLPQEVTVEPHMPPSSQIQ